MIKRANLLKIVSAVVLCSAWEIAGRIPVSYAFPTFLDSMRSFFEMIGNGMMLEAYKETLQPLVIGVLISAFLGIGLGLWIGLNNFFDWLLVLAYGIGLTSKVMVVCIMAMPVIVLNTSGAVRNTPESFKEMGKSFLASRASILLRIVIPAASPVIFAGLRLGVSAGFIGAILAELKITPTGVGDIITFSRSIADYPSMYAAIFSIILLAVLFLNLIEKLETVLFKGNQRGYVSD
jgi:NitT/TauT family transport system permease protein